MSPTWITVSTSGSALTESMNAGVAANSAVSVGLVPYGASPYTATVNAAFGPPWAGPSESSAQALLTPTAAVRRAVAARVTDRLNTSTPRHRGWVRAAASTR